MGNIFILEMIYSHQGIARRVDMAVPVHLRAKDTIAVAMGDVRKDKSKNIVDATSTLESMVASWLVKRCSRSTTSLVSDLARFQGSGTALRH